MLIAQLAPTATLVPQVWLTVKAALVTERLLMVSTAVPLLVKVTVCARVGDPTVALKLSPIAGESDTTGAVTTGATPVPLNVTVLGELPALVTKLRVPETAPLTVGAKRVEITQLPVAAKLVPQVWLTVKAA